MKRIQFLLVASAWLLWIAPAKGAVPQMINFQGILRDTLGNVVSDGAHNATFAIYSDSNSTPPVWAETTSVTTERGLFTVLLGSVTPVATTVFESPSAWLGIEIAN